MPGIAFVNGTIRTVDPQRPTAEALLVEDGRIVAVGSGDEVGAITPSTAEVIDLDGRCLLPGFQDAHCHPSQAGLEMAACDLLAMPEDRSSYLEAVAAYAASHPEAAWIVGGGWSMGAFPGGIASSRDLDDVVSDRPVFLWNRDHHGAWVNSKALEIAGIDRSAPDPPDGRIERDPRGEPTGTLQEGAADLVGRIVPPPTSTERQHAILEAQAYLFSLGITAWQDAMVDPDTHAAYLAVAGDGRLRGRCVGCLWWERAEDERQVARLEEQRAQTPVGTYRATTVKIMQDGVCENFTAAMLAPYLDSDGVLTANTGHSFIDSEQLNRAVAALDAAGFQVHFHALGDRAVRECLDAVEHAMTVNGAADRRHHLAHLQLVDREDRVRFARLAVGANAQPLWAHHDSYQDELTIPFLGAERSAAQYPWRSLLDAGVSLVLGSDWPVSTPDPFEIMHVAVERHHPEGRDPAFFPSERISIEEALAAYTAGSAWVNHAEDTTGTLTEGKLADVVIVDRDPVVEGPLGCRVDMTVIGGEVVFER